ncbi:MAG: heavy-metal-associated domain-containing protein [Tannerella sp.]|nr:heavy-metal-associated domain-containing protein [Tannerella sp.]
MKRILLMILCAMFTLSMASAKDGKKEKKAVTKFKIENMNCDNCVKKIEKNIAFEKGVTDLKCDLETKTAEVTYNTDKTSEEKLVKAFEKINYKATAIKEDDKK